MTTKGRDVKSSGLSAKTSPTGIARQLQTIIRGQLTDRDGVPAARRPVRLLQQGLRAPKVFATTHSDAHGRYEFRLDGADEIPAKGLTVEVTGRGAMPAASRGLPVLVKGQAHTVNLAVEPNQSLFEHLNERVKSALHGTRLSTVAQDELDRLGKLAGIARNDLEALRRADALANDLGTPAPIAFALCREGDLSGVDDVFTLPADEQRRRIAAAAAHGCVPRQSAANIHNALVALQKRAIERAAPQRPSERQLTLGDASALAQLNSNEKAVVAQLWLRQQNASGFAKALQRERRLAPGKRQELERIFAIGAVTQGDAKLAAALAKDSRIKTGRDLARLQPSDFLKLVQDELQLSGDAARKRATSLDATASESYPQVALLRDVALSSELSEKAQAVAGGLLDRDSFNLTASPIDDALAKNDAAAELSEDERLNLREQLRRGQRLLRLVDGYRPAKILEQNKIGSAHDVVGLGRSDFIKRVGGKDALSGTVDDIYDRAERAAAASLALFAKFSPALNKVGTVATPIFPTLFDGISDLETLFGQQTLCACESCRSVVSPAAYFVDLLAFLRNSDNNAGARNALDALTDPGARGRPARRPDLLRIGLTCENTTTVVPYADLVLEILEQAVAPQTPYAPQTALASDVIATAPEHVNRGAYAKLAGALYPIGLPFSSPETEARMFLDRLGTRRAELMETFAALVTPADPTDPVFSFATDTRARADIVIAGESLKLAAGERKIISGKPLRGDALPVQYLWGFPLGVADWMQRLAKLPEFLDRSGLEYLEALALFNLKALSAGTNPAPAFSFSDPASCDPANIGITGLSAAYLDRLARFLRLWRKLGWTPRDVDRALAALADRDGAGAPLLDDAFLVRLAHVARLRGTRDLAIAEMLGWWADLDTADYNADHLPATRSYFAEIFERNARTGDGGKAPLNLADVTAGNAGTVDGQVLAISAALSISAADCALLIDKLAASGEPVSLAALSLLHRHVSLARWLGASLADLLAFRDLAGDPFDGGTPRDTGRTLAFIARWQAFSASGMPLEALTYLLTDADRPDRPVAPTQSSTDAFLRDLQEGLSGTTSGSALSRADIIAQRVATQFGLALAGARMLLVALPVAGGKAFDALDAVSSIDLTQDPADQATADRLRAARDAFRLLHKVALVTSWLDLRGTNGLNWMLGQAPALGWLDLTTMLAPPGPAALDRWMRLADFAEFNRSISTDKRDDIFALFALGAVNPNNSAARAERQAYLDALRALTGWRLEDLRTLIGMLNVSGGQRVSVLGTQFPYHFRDEQLPVRLLRGMRLLARTSTSPSTLGALIARDPNANGLGRLAQCAREAAQVAWPVDRWPALAREVRDELRDQQRAALVLFLVADQRLSGPNALFDHFLADVEMTSCGKTTRIHAAILSVQLFVQRALMGLERGVTFSAEAMNQWEWMRGYESWATNRKIFLYPENWLTQELRDDKTPFFRELESELMRDDITADSAELAFRHYLEKLDDVSRLQICGIYVEEASKTRGEFVHVFGRTRNTPPVYYYRQRFGGTRWTAWERVEADVEGDHLVPIVFEGRLLLFWPIFAEKDSGPFQADAFLRPLFDLINIIVQAANGIGATVGAVVGAYNKLLDTIAQSVSSLSAGAATVDVSSFKLDASGFPDDPIDAAVSAAAALLELAVDEHPLKRLLDLLPSKIWDIRLGWSEYRSGQWSARKTSSQSLQFKDKIGPLLAQLCALAQEANNSRGQQESVSAFDRRRMFTFDGSIDNDILTIRAHVGLIGIDPLNGDLDGTYRRQLGGFSLLDCRGTLTAFYPQREPFDYLDDLLGQLQELAVGSVLTVAGAIEGEPVTADDDPEGTFKRVTIPALLRNLAPNNYAIMAPHQYEPRTVLGRPKAYLAPDPRLDDFFFLQDARRTFAVSRSRFETAYHPYACMLIELLNRGRSSSLFDPEVQQLRSDQFRQNYNPTPAVARPLPIEDVDYTRVGGYAQYNWELFFHAPMLIAERLIANQKFADALKWLHAVFDPTDHRAPPAPARFWKPRPFAELARADYQRQSLLELANAIAGKRGSDAQRELDALVEDWRENPFDAHRVARLRITAYQKSVVMDYIDALIQWADQLFRQDDAESVNEATRLYVLADAILGPRPRDIFPLKEPPAKVFSELELDAFSNALVELEHFHWAGGVAAPGRAATPVLAAIGRLPTASPSNAAAALKADLRLAPNASRALMHSAWIRLIGARALYFCLPQNPKLLGYWDTVADRLFKIRHCLDIAGVPRDVVLPQGILMDDSGYGSDNDANVPAQTPLCYRFTVLAQKATELCADVKTLGGAMLAALEKSDAEQLALLRQTHERRVLEAAREVKVLQVTEALAALAALEESQRSAQLRRDYYAERLAAPISALEAEQIALTGSSVALQGIEAGAMLGAVALSVLPDFITGFPIAAAVEGGQGASGAAERASRNLGILSSLAGSAGSLVGTVAAFERRAQEWGLQKDLAETDLRQLAKQIEAAQARINIAQRDLANQDLQIDQAREVDDFLRTKTTSQALYGWMIGQLSAVYFQSYQLAYDMARKAEQAWRFEIGQESSNFISFGYWDSLKQGLVSGEWLHHDLKRMEAAYLDNNHRELEIVKHISLQQLDPYALIELIETGACTFTVPEAFFDIDFPGHYMRRMKSVSLTIPAVIGPYASVNATLRLESGDVRVDDSLIGGNYARRSSDSRFRSGRCASDSIVVSSAQADSGLFETNLRDDRYLPFEGAGAISAWRLELGTAFHPFDYETISDVVLHLRYTAREGDADFRSQVETELDAAVNRVTTAAGDAGLGRAFSLRHEFPSQWQKFLSAPVDGGAPTFAMPITAGRFPALFARRGIRIQGADVLIRLGTAGEQLEPAGLGVSLTPGSVASSDDLGLRADSATTLLLAREASGGDLGGWTLSLWQVDSSGDRTPLDPSALDDIIVIFRYKLA